MQVSKITFTNNQTNDLPQVKNSKKDKLLTAGYLAGGIAAGEGIMLVCDQFCYKKKLNEINNQCKEKEIKDIKIMQELLEKSGKQITPKEEDAIKQMVEIKVSLHKDNMIGELKEYRTKYLKKWGLISAGLGLIAGIGAKVITAKIDNKKKENNKNITNISQSTYNSDYYFHKQAKDKMLSFTGVIEEYADVCSDEEIKEMYSYVKGTNPTPKELQEAEKIASYKMSDWPKGIKKNKGWSGYIRDIYLPYYNITKPANEYEYQMMILKQNYKIPPKPPKYYRRYDKFFKTEKYNSVMNDTLPYIKAGLKFERMKNLVNKIRLENYQKQKIMYDTQAKKQLSLACIKSKINKDFLIDFNSDDKNAKVFNAILIESKDIKEREKNIQWIVAKANSHYVYIQDNNDSNDVRVNQIYNVLEDAESNFKKDGKRTLLVVENFDKLLDKSPENEEIVGDLKDLLCKLNSEYHTTLLFDADNTNQMDPIALQSHRVAKYNLDKEIPIEELKKFKNEFVKSNIHKMESSDGFQYKYIPFQDKYIDLYLGDFGYSKNILWINSNNSEQISAVLYNLDGIKMIPKFKDITKVRFPKPDNMEELKIFEIINTSNKTLDNKLIYEYEIK